VHRAAAFCGSSLRSHDREHRDIVNAEGRRGGETTDVPTCSCCSVGAASQPGTTPNFHYFQLVTPAEPLGPGVIHLAMLRSLPHGILIAFEGIDGAGKTTQAEILARRLEHDGFDVVRTKEPTSGPWGQRIRDSAAKGRMPPDEELSAFIEDRKQHVSELIRPALERGKIVIIDRYYLSTVAYQGARGHDPAALLVLNESFAPRPDLIVLLEIPVEIGQRRIVSRGDVANFFEVDVELTKAAAIFSAMRPAGLLRLDGQLSIQELGDQILWTFLEGPLAHRLEPEATGPMIPARHAPRFLAEVERIRNDDNIPANQKAEAVLRALAPLIP
jgi:dTMP kinase